MGPITGPLYKSVNIANGRQKHLYYDKWQSRQHHSRGGKKHLITWPEFVSKVQCIGSRKPNLILPADEVPSMILSGGQVEHKVERNG
jgi:hypothetical protein